LKLGADGRWRVAAAAMVRRYRMNVGTIVESPMLRVRLHPEVTAQLREQVKLADIVEEVFLTAFDTYDDRPQAVPFSEWLENHIDPSVKLISNASDEELDNISFARTLVEE
jgi:hypothetical protein